MTPAQHRRSWPSLRSHPPPRIQRGGGGGPTGRRCRQVPRLLCPRAAPDWPTARRQARAARGDSRSERRVRGTRCPRRHVMRDRATSCRAPSWSGRRPCVARRTPERTTAVAHVKAGAERDREPGVARDHQGQRSRTAESRERMTQRRAVSRRIVPKHHAGAPRKAGDRGERVGKPPFIGEEPKRRQSAAASHLPRSSPVEKLLIHRTLG